jgi:hypothetical protein
MLLSWQGQRAMLDWCYAGHIRPIDPFFDQTIEECLRHPFNLLFRQQTPIEVLGELHAARPGLSPTGFIFHMSRCGSTLITQMLAALPQNIVISEAGTIHAALGAHHRDDRITGDIRLRWFEWLISALGRQQHTDEQHFFIKFDAWDTVELPLIRRAFPGVPWLFLYRDPIEVLVSHSNRRGPQLMPGAINPEVLGLDPAAVFQMEPERYSAIVLAEICRAALANQKDGGKFVNYRQLPETIYASLLEFFKVSYAADEIEQMRHASRFHAKYPSTPFTDDTATKRLQATDAIRRSADELLYPLYEQLEQARHAQETNSPDKEPDLGM